VPDPLPKLYNRSFAFAFLSQVGFVLSNTMMAHYARWISFLGGDDADIGWVMGAGALVGLVARPWIGQWIDRFGARRMWLVGQLLFGLGTLLNVMIRAVDFWIYLPRAVNVLGASFVFSSSLAYITHLAPKSRRTEAIGVLGCAGFVGIIIGPYLGQLILAGDRTRDDFLFLFCAASGALLIPSLLLLSLPEQKSSEQTGRFRFLDFVECSRRYWPGAICLVQLAFGMCMTVPFVFMTRFVDEIGAAHSGDFRDSAVSWFFACYAGCGLVVRLSSRRIPDRIGRRKVLLAGCLTMGIGMLIFSRMDVANPWLLLIVSALICGTGHALMFHTATALFLEPFPPEKRGVGAALALMVMDIGMVGGAPLLGIIAEQFGYGTVFLTVAGSCFIAGTVYAASSVPVWKARLKAS
jgi:MFS family permease